MDQTTPETDSGSQKAVADPALTPSSTSDDTLQESPTASPTSTTKDNNDVSDLPVPTTTAILKPKTAGGSSAGSAMSSSHSSDGNNNSSNSYEDDEKDMSEKDGDNKPMTRTKKWTDTNSDKHCIQQKKNPLARLVYSVSLATGYYAIEPLDKRLSLVLAYVLLAISMLLLYVFYQGFQDGMDSMTVQEVTESTKSAAKVATEAVVAATAAAMDPTADAGEGLPPNAEL